MGLSVSDESARREEKLDGMSEASFSRAAIIAVHANLKVIASGRNSARQLLNFLCSIYQVSQEHKFNVHYIAAVDLILLKLLLHSDCWQISYSPFTYN